MIGRLGGFSTNLEMIKQNFEKWKVHFEKRNDQLISLNISWFSTAIQKRFWKQSWRAGNGIKDGKI